MSSESWSVDSWRGRPGLEFLAYEDAVAVESAMRRLRSLPPLVTSFEIEQLKAELAEAQEGKRFILQGGDCAETFSDCREEQIANKIKILLQMSILVAHGCKKPVTLVGRFAGQYAKPRSSHTEARESGAGPTRLPSYFGDLVNGVEFSEADRKLDPQRLLSGYQHAAMTLNYIRALTKGGFADFHHPEYWELGFVQEAEMPPELRFDYQSTIRLLGDALRFTEALSGGKPIHNLSRVEFFTAHEGLNLYYESAQTRTDAHHSGHYDLTTHMPWIGERNRQLDGAHVEFFRGVQNPVAVKIGPKTSSDDALALLDRLNPDDEPGKSVLVVRMGAEQITDVLPRVVDGVRKSGRRVLWVSDPMHGNTRTTSSGTKTRRFDDILREIALAFDICEAAGVLLGGLHFELTGDDVTECVGSGTSESDLVRNYTSVCDPRLNYRQAMEMAFRVARRMGAPRHRG